MLKIKKVLIIIYIIFLILNIYNFQVMAKAEAIVTLKSNKDKFMQGEDIEITVNLENSNTSAFNFNLYFDTDKLEFIDDQDYINIVDNKIIYVWYDKSGGENSKTGEITKLKFKAKSDGICSFLIDGNFYNEKGQEIDTDFNSVQIKIGETKEISNLQKQTEEINTKGQSKTNSKLQLLRIDQEGVSPNFNKDTFDYYLVVAGTINNIDILAVPENTNATVNITGNKNLVSGLNKIQIEVISEDQSQKNIYTINVTKTNDAEVANTNLETLAIENVLLYPVFDNIETKYSAEISEKIEKLNILAIPENEKAKVEISGNENLKEGENTITITVTAPNGYTKKEFVILVYKRNLEEEKKFINEQENNKQELEHAYEIEKLSIDEEEKIAEEISVDKEKNKNRNLIVMIVAVIIGVVVIILLVRFFIFRK